jgi:hypothetical protein
MRLNAWKQIPTPRLRNSLRALPSRCVTLVVPTRTSPFVGLRIPPRTESNVVFPQPDGPSSTASSPSAARRFS